MSVIGVLRMVCQDFRCFLGLIGNMGGPWGGPTIGVPGPGTKGGRVSVSVTCSADMVLGHDRSDTSARETHGIMLYLGSLDTLLGRVWRLTVLLDLVMAELPGLDRECCLSKVSSVSV